VRLDCKETRKRTISLPPIPQISARGRCRRSHVPSIRNDNINRPNSLRSAGESPLQRHLIRDISHKPQYPRITRLFQLCCGFAEGFLATPGDDDGFRPGLVESCRDVLAYTAAAAGDEDDFSCGRVGGVGWGDGWVDGAVDCAGVGLPFPGWGRGGHGCARLVVDDGFRLVQWCCLKCEGFEDGVVLFGSCKLE
jgi:hypothetical protein